VSSAVVRERPPTLPLVVKFPDAFLDGLADRAARLVLEHLTNAPDPWIGVDAAAAHLACPKSRIYRLVSQRAIPFEKDGARLLFRRADLDAWVEKGGAGR
jgi:excisionase family DNA binding protein